MQEEVTKHGKKIYRTIKSPSHSTAEKIKDIIIEIAIIVFAVTLSIWLHGRTEHRHEQVEVSTFLKGLKADLQQDIVLLERNRDVAIRLDSSYRFLLAIASQKVAAPADSNIYRNLYFDLRVTRPSIGRYEGFKSSGKIGLIEDDSLKQNILAFYQQTIPGLVYGEEFVNSLQTKILDLQIDKTDKTPIIEFVRASKTASLFSLSSQNLSGNVGIYNRAITGAKTIIAQIEAIDR
jgi:hypothetical protein